MSPEYELLSALVGERHCPGFVLFARPEGGTDNLNLDLLFALLSFIRKTGLTLYGLDFLFRFRLYKAPYLCNALALFDRYKRPRWIQLLYVLIKHERVVIFNYVQSDRTLKKTNFLLFLNLVLWLSLYLQTLSSRFDRVLNLQDI